MSQTATVQTPEVKPIKAGKFFGAFAGFSLGAYNLLLASGITNGAAHKIAGDYASDLARGMKDDAEIASKVSKANKSGESVVKFNGKTEKMRMTLSMGIVRIAQIGEQLKTEGFVAKRPPLDSLKLNDNLAEYLQESQAWADKQTWVTE